MVPIPFTPALMQTYQEKCNLVYNANIRALITLCGLDKPAQFQKILLTALEKNTLKTNDHIKAFVNLAAPHTKGNNLVFQLLQNTTVSFNLLKNLETIKRYQEILTLDQMIKENKLPPEALSNLDKELINPDSEFTQQVSKIQNYFSNSENLYQIDYNEMIAKLMEEFLDEAEGKTAEKIKAEKEKKYKKILDEEILLSDDSFEDESGEIDWVQFREKVIWAALDKIAKEKTLSSMGFSFGLTLAFDVPFNLLQNLYLQIQAIYKKRAKKTAENRKKRIEKTLKKHGLNKDKLALLLAEDAKEWIFNNKNVEKYNSKNNKPKTRALKFELRKKEFVESLKKDENGNISPLLFTKRQKEKYIYYLEKYANQFEWTQKACYLCGVYLTSAEKEEIIESASKKAFTVRFNLNKKMSPKEIQEKLEEIKKKNPPQIKQSFDKENLLIPISDEINQLIDYIDKNKTLSNNQINILKQSLNTTNKNSVFINNVLYFIENKTPLPKHLKNDIFEALAKEALQNKDFSLFAARNRISMQQMAKQTIQNQQNAYFIKKWAAQKFSNSNQNQRAG